jgi:collagenase-like PrtC family protease
LGKRFYRYVVHAEDCQDAKLLDQLDRTKAEILVNETCLRGCPRRDRHFELIARLHKDLRDNQFVVAGGPGDTLLKRRLTLQELEQFAAACQAMPYDRQIGKRQRNCNLTSNELKSVYDMGFRHFKIQGRNDHPLVFAYDLTRYTLEPGCAAPLVYKVLLMAILGALVAKQAPAT